MENKIVKIAAGFIVGSIALSVIGTAMGYGAQAINKLAYNHKIKKGLKNGSIIEIDGKYYKVEWMPAEEA